LDCQAERAALFDHLLHKMDVMPGVRQETSIMLIESEIQKTPNPVRNDLGRMDLFHNINP
jgi:hypothetical protein